MSPEGFEPSTKSLKGFCSTTELRARSPYYTNFRAILHLKKTINSMWNEVFIYVGVTLAFAGSLNYLLDTLRGKVQPNRVTFLMWGVVPLIAYIAQQQKGVGIQSLMTLSVALQPLLIFLASFFNKKAQWKLKPFDFVCGGFSLLGLLLWIYTKEGNIAIFFSILADSMAALPTIIKSYQHPESESYWAYITASINGFLTLGTIKVWTFAQWGFPLYIFGVNMVIFIFVFFKLNKKIERIKSVRKEES